MTWQGANWEELAKPKARELRSLRAVKAELKKSERLFSGIDIRPVEGELEFALGFALDGARVNGREGAHTILDVRKACDADLCAARQNQEAMAKVVDALERTREIAYADQGLASCPDCKGAKGRHERRDGVLCWYACESCDGRGMEEKREAAA